MKLEPYSMGCGDRFAREAAAQLEAFARMAADGPLVVPVWNKSNREHEIIRTHPSTVRAAAEAAVRASGWTAGWHVDADHINLDTVEPYLESSDFFTMDVADAIGAAVAEEDVAAFLRRRADLVDRPVTIPGRNDELIIPSDRALDIIRTYLPAVQAAGRIYRRIREARNEDSFIPEISMDETDRPQGPAELLLILAAVADEGIPIQTIAPRFPGRFNKGVEYVGDPELFGREFESDIQVVRYAAGAFGFPENLKLSVHSGSDKFAVYPEINRLIRSYGVGVHLKTAGTNWCEEIVGLAEAGGDGLDLAKTVYREAHKKREALCGPYAEVIDIQDSRLPDPRDVATWDSERFVRSLRHEPDELYNADFRQLIHVGYKVAAGMGPVFLDALAVHRSSVARNVTHNLYERHLKPIFGGL